MSIRSLNFWSLLNKRVDCFLVHYKNFHLEGVNFMLLSSEYIPISGGSSAINLRVGAQSNVLSRLQKESVSSTSVGGGVSCSGFGISYR